MHACLHKVWGPYPGTRRLKVNLARHCTHARPKVSLECSNLGLWEIRTKCSHYCTMTVTACSHTYCTLRVTNISQRTTVSCVPIFFGFTFMIISSHICFIEHQHFSQMSLTISQKGRNGSEITKCFVAVAIVGHGGKGGR